MANRIHSTGSSIYPLVRSITLEIHERCVRVLLLETLVDHVEATSSDPRRRGLLVAEQAMHRRELRAARTELQRLGWSISEMGPESIRVRRGDEHDGSVEILEIETEF